MKVKAADTMPKYGLPILGTAILLVFVATWHFTASLQIGVVGAFLAAAVLGFGWFMGAYLPYGNTVYEIDDKGILISRGDRKRLVPMDTIKKAVATPFGVWVYCKNGSRLDLRPAENRLGFLKEIVDRLQSRTTP
jgi:hypothetical protein